MSAPVAIEDLIQDPPNEALVQAQLKGLELTREIESGLPDVLVDRVKICRVLSNLLSNALNFTEPGGKVRIEVQKSRSEKWMPWMRKGTSVHIEGMAEGDKGKVFVQFSVCDTGAGIPPENLFYVFDPYWHSKQEGTGTGLGLAVVKRIVTAHRGFLAVRSRVGVGSEFYFTLPAAEDTLQKADSPRPLRYERVLAPAKSQINRVQGGPFLSSLAQLESGNCPNMCQRARFEAEQPVRGRVPFMSSYPTSHSSSH